MPRDPFVELEAARANVLEAAERFVEELKPVLGASLHAGFERLRLAQVGHVAGFDGPTTALDVRAVSYTHLTLPTICSV